MPRDRRPPVSYREPSYEPSYEPRPSSSGSLNRSNAFRSSSRPSSSHRDAYHPGLDLGSLAGEGLPMNGRYHAPSHGVPHRSQSSYYTEGRRPSAHHSHTTPGGHEPYRPHRSSSSRTPPDEYMRDSHRQPYEFAKHYPPPDYETYHRREESNFGRVSPVRYPYLEPDSHPTWNRRDSSLGTQTYGSSRSHLEDWPGERYTSAGHRVPFHGPHRSGSASSSLRTRPSLSSSHDDYETVEYRPGPNRTPHMEPGRRRR